jgi:hypothetical protein
MVLVGVKGTPALMLMMLDTAVVWAQEALN